MDALDVSGSTEPNGDHGVGDGDVVPGQGDESLEWLPEDEKNNGDGPVSDGHVGAVDVLVDRFGLGLDVELGARAAAVGREPKIGFDESALESPAEESARDAACRGAAGLPGIQIALAELVEKDSSVTKPGQEVDRDGDGLLGPQEGATAGDVAIVHPAQDVPADEAGDDVTVVGMVEPIDGRPGSIR